MSRIWSVAVVAFCGAALGACGGGGGGGGTTIGGIGGSGGEGGRDLVSVGSITGFGSVSVNGVRFDTTGTTFDIEGSTGSQDDLAVGDVVIIVGSLNEASDSTGVASEIRFDDQVDGPIASGSIDTVAGRFVVLGQTVDLTADTSFDGSIEPGSLEGLGNGDIVGVSGFRASDGSIRATRIEREAAGRPFEVIGLVNNLDSAAFTFEINALGVDYSGALIEDFGDGMLTEGSLVKVSGSAFGVGGALIATRVENKSDDVVRETGDRVELEGLITRFASASDFDVAELAVTTNPQTVFDGGTAADLGLDVKVEIEGVIDAASVLVATRVHIRAAQRIRVTAVVDSTSLQNDSFVVLGITVATDSLTRFEDKSSRDVRSFSVDDLFLGDYLEVRGYESPPASGRILAGLIEREDLDARTELRGIVTSESGTAFTVLGVTISTSAATQFRDENDAPISSATFFNRIGVGSLVDVDGFEIGARALSANEAKIELQ